MSPYPHIPAVFCRVRVPVCMHGAMILLWVRPPSWPLSQGLSDLSFFWLSGSQLSCSFCQLPQCDTNTTKSKRCV